MVKRTKQTTARLECKLTEHQRVEAGNRLAELCAKRTNALTAKAHAASAHAAQIKAIEADIEQAQAIVIRGHETREVSCLWEFDTPRSGFKTLIRMDTGEPVTVEEMTFDEKQGSLFPQAEPEAEPAEEAVVAVEPTEPEPEPEPENAPEVIEAPKLPKGAAANITITRCPPDGTFLGLYTVKVDGITTEEIGGVAQETRDKAIHHAAECLEADVGEWLREVDSKKARAHLLAIGKWARSLLAEAEDTERAQVLEVIKKGQTAPAAPNDETVFSFDDPRVETAQPCEGLTVYMLEVEDGQYCVGLVSTNPAWVTEMPLEYKYRLPTKLEALADLLESLGDDAGEGDTQSLRGAWPQGYAALADFVQGTDTPAAASAAAEAVAAVEEW